MRAQIKKQIASLKAQIEEEKQRKKGGRSSRSWFIEKHGAAQIVLIGLTKSGKSTLLSKVTNAKPLISNYPFTTTEPIAGMLKYQDIAFQLVEAPSLQLSEDASWNFRTVALAKNADGLIILLDLQADSVYQFKFIRDTLDASKVSIEKSLARVVIERKNISSGIQMLGKLTDSTLENVKQLLNSYKIYNAIVKIYGDATLDDVEDAIFERIFYKPSIVLANKFDSEDADSKFRNLEKFIPNKLKALPISCNTGWGLENLGFQLFVTLEIIRVYTKLPTVKQPSSEPIIMKAGSSALDVAKEIHSAFYKNFNFAKIWGKSAKYNGEKVGSEHILKDGDVVELHMK